MPFLGVISAGNLVKMRGSASIEPRHSGAVYLSACPNTNVYTARINQATFESPLAELAFDGGSGTLANVLAGMTVLISHTNDRTAAFFRGRVRKTPAGAALYINETDGSQFENDDYIFVLDDFALHEKLARDVNGTLYPDWDVAFRQLKPLIRGLKSGYADWVSSNVYTLSFAPTVTAATNGATISTYLWDVADGTITVGADSDKDITVTFPPGFRWISLTATDSNSVAQTRYIPVWAHDPATYPPQILETGELTVSASIGDGYNASVTAFDGVNAILDNTLVCAWIDEEYNSTAQHIDDNIIIVGRFRSEANQTEWNDDGNQDSSVSFEIEGVIAQMSRLRISPLEISPGSSPAAFNQIASLTIWRAVHLLLTEYSTFADLHSMYFDDTGTTFLYGTLTTAGQDIKTSVLDLGESINAVLQASATGECEFVRKAVYLSAAARNALATVANLTPTDLVGVLGYNKDHVKTVGRISADGGAYNSSTGETSAYLASAPPGAPGSGADETELRRQVLQANQSVADQKTELCARIGNALAEAQSITSPNVVLPDGYWFLTPDAAAWYTLTLAGTETAREIVLTTATRWILSSIETTFDNELGTIGVSAVLTKETSGIPGEIVYLPDVNTGEYPVTLGDFEEPIALPVVVPEDNVFDFTPGDQGWVSNAGTHDADGWDPACIGGTEEKLDIYYEFTSPVSLTGMAVVYTAVYAGGADNQDQFLARLNDGSWIELLAFTTATGTDQTNSVTLATPVVVTAIRLIMYAGGNDCTGSLTVTSITYTALEAQQGWRQEWDFTTSLYDWTIDTFQGYPTGVWVDGVGLRGVYKGTLGVDGSYRIAIKSAVVADTAVTKGAIVFQLDPDENNYEVFVFGGYTDGVGSGVWFNYPGIYSPTPFIQGYQEATSTITLDQVIASLANIHAGGSTPADGATCDLILTKIIVWGTGVNPWL